VIRRLGLPNHRTRRRKVAANVDFGREEAAKIAGPKKKDGEARSGQKGTGSQRMAVTAQRKAPSPASSGSNISGCDESTFGSYSESESRPCLLAAYAMHSNKLNRPLMVESVPEGKASAVFAP
jgi:hypothetical protein